MMLRCAHGVFQDQISQRFIGERGEFVTGLSGRDVFRTRDLDVMASFAAHDGVPLLRRRFDHYFAKGRFTRKLSAR